MGKSFSLRDWDKKGLRYTTVGRQTVDGMKEGSEVKNQHSDLCESTQTEKKTSDLTTAATTSHKRFLFVDELFPPETE